MCWNIENNGLRGHVFDHHRSGPCDTTFLNTHPLDDRRSRSYMNPRLKRNISRHSRSGRDVGVKLNVTVIINRSMHIDNHIYAGRCAGLDYSTGHHLYSPNHRYVGLDDSIRMDVCGKLESVSE